MNSPIRLVVPHYFDLSELSGATLMFRKGAPLCAGDLDDVSISVSLELIESYECRVEGIDQKFREIAVHCLKRDVVEDQHWPGLVSGCKVFTYQWNPVARPFKIVWIQISAELVLQIAAVFGPEQPAYFRNHFNESILKTEIDLDFDFLANLENPKVVFGVDYFPLESGDLLKMIAASQVAVARKLFLQENLRVGSPAFFDLLEEEWATHSEVAVETLICGDWKLHYDLGNPENFQSPELLAEWDLPSRDLYTYIENPKASPVILVRRGSGSEPAALRHLVEHQPFFETNFLDFFRDYTFGGGGAYAAPEHFRHAKAAIENDLGKAYTVDTFLQDNLCLRSVEIGDDDELLLHFDCSWDCEHGITLSLHGEQIEVVC